MQGVSLALLHMVLQPGDVLTDARHASYAVGRCENEGMITAEELQSVRIFSCLEEAERQRLASKAADVRLEAGEWVFREGELPWFFVLLEGELALSKDVMGREQELHRYKRGDFFGEIPILLGAPAFASVRAQTDARVARVARQPRLAAGLRTVLLLIAAIGLAGVVLQHLCGPR